MKNKETNETNETNELRLDLFIVSLIFTIITIGINNTQKEIQMNTQQKILEQNLLLAKKTTVIIDQELTEIENKLITKTNKLQNLQAKLDEYKHLERLQKDIARIWDKQKYN